MVNLLILNLRKMSWINYLEGDRYRDDYTDFADRSMMIARCKNIVDIVNNPLNSSKSPFR